MLHSLTKKLSLILSISSILGLTVSCTSDLPEIESENMKETVFSIDSFSASIRVNLNEEIRAKSLQKLDLIKTQNNYKKVTLNYVSGDESLKELVQDITLNLPVNTPSSLELKFDVNDSQLVVKTNSIQVLDKNQYRSNQNVYLFQYQITGYGIKRRVKNQLGEETRNIEFHSTTKESATHIKISSPFLENVQLGGIDTLSESQKTSIFNRSNLMKNIFTLNEVSEIFKNLEKENSIEDLNLNSEKLYTFSKSRNHLLIQEVITENELTEIEKQNISLNNNSVVLQRCSNEVKTKAKRQSCYLRSVARIAASDVVIRPKQDFNGKNLAIIDLENTDSQSSIISIVGSSFETSENDRQSFLINSDKLVIDKNEIDFDAEYIYLPSTHGTPRDVVNAAPFFQGQERIVKLKMKKEGLLVYQEDPDSRFRDNEHNESPVLLIGGSHLDLSCEEADSDGNCLKIDNTTKSWEEKKYFQPGLDKFNHLQTNEVDLFTLGGSCIYEVYSKMSHAEIKKGVINVEQIKTYKVAENSRCMVELFYDDNLKSSSFTVKHFFSLVRLNDLASTDYNKFNYPQENHQLFGFFKDQNTEKGQDYTSSRERTKYLLNRFNPKKGEIVYKLSEEFGRAGNKYILDATKDVVEKINNSLNAANTKLQIKLEDPSKVFPGDLRNNTLVLITDPLANGLLGYGPSVSNPRTGEILQAHTNMYLGVLRTGARRTYKFMEEMAKEKPIQAVSTSPSISSNGTNRLMNLPSRAKQNISGIEISVKTQEALEDHGHHLHADAPVFNHQVEINERDYMPLVGNKADLDNAFNGVHAGDFESLISGPSLFEKTLDFYAKNNAFHEEAMNFHALGKVIIPEIKEIPGIVKSNGELLSWEKLNTIQKESAIKIIVAHAYKTTLAHEIGHNLGLRHNFQGSFDKDNFYTKAELPSGSKHLSPKYSSIMDYGASELNELPILGKYDIAALRYGYANEIEMENGSIQKVAGDDILRNLKRKKYLFCTDENAGGSIECNRFDEGSTIEEIVDHYIRRYKNSYTAANLRDGRQSFKSYSLPRYIQYKYYSMMGIRDALDKYNFFRSIFGQEALNGQCPEMYPICVQVNDVYRATLKAGNFFREIINTPDLTCVIEKAGQKTLKPFTQLYNKVKYESNEDVITSCFHSDIAKALDTGESIVAEGGKLLNDLSGTHSLIRSQYDIDVRGIWSDKLLAVKMLFGRMSGSDQTAGLSPLSFIEHPEFSNDLFGYISHLTLGEALPKANKFTDKNGNMIDVKYELNQDIYLASRPTWFPTLVFGFPPYSGADLNELILKNIYKSNRSTDPQLRDHTKMIREMISIYKKSYISENETDEVLTHISGTEKFVAGKGNQIAYTMISVMKNALELATVSPNLAKIVLDNKVNRDAPSSYSAEEKTFFKLEDQLITAIVGYFSNNPPDKTLVEYMAMVKNIDLAQSLLNAQNLGHPRLVEIQKDKSQIYSTKVTCDNARNLPDTQGDAQLKQQLCKLYDLLWSKNNSILYLKGEGLLKDRAEAYKTRIKKLPSQNSSEYNFIEQLMENY